MGEYFGFPKWLSIICVIIPFTAWILGAITRFTEKKILAGLIRLFFIGFFIWVGDLINTIINGCNPQILKIIDC